MIQILQYIKQWEGFKPKAYYATPDEEKRNIATIGYGFTEINGKPVRIGDTITIDQADQMLTIMLNIKSKILRTKINEYDSLLQNQKDALISLAYNTGPGAFPTLISYLNANDKDKAYEEFFDCIYQSGKPLKGLIYRRACDAKIFNDGVYEKRHYITRPELSIFILKNGKNFAAADMLSNQIKVK